MIHISAETKTTNKRKHKAIMNLGDLTSEVPILKSETLNIITSWWFQPIWKILVKLFTSQRKRTILSRDLRSFWIGGYTWGEKKLIISPSRDENKTYLSCHLAMIITVLVLATKNGGYLMIYHPFFFGNDPEHPPESWNVMGFIGRNVLKTPKQDSKKQIREMIRWANLWNKS